MPEKNLLHAENGKDETSYSILDSRLPGLLSQAERFAGSIRYYNSTGRADGYFDQFLNDLREIREKGVENFTPDGNLEPAQALLLTFLQQLHETGQRFNTRWDTLFYWYINEILNVKALPEQPDFTWIAFSKNKAGDILVPQRTAFSYDQAEDENRIVYRLTHDLTVSDTCIEKLYSLNFEHQPDILPAAYIHCPSSLQLHDLLNEPYTGRMLFEPHTETTTTQPLGLQISSPALLLREGKRTVTLVFELEKITVSFSAKRCLVILRRKAVTENPETDKKEALSYLFLKLLKDIFFLEISTPEGWAAIPEYALKGNAGIHNNSLILRFELSESFPATTSCNADIHGITTPYPTLKILLNHDAWLFPYVWLKNLFISKIFIETEVEGVSNILFYNDLGQVDTAKPFAPFGISTERLSRFILGCYETAVKNVSNMEVRIRWQQLPDHEGGLASYYKDYEKGQINNRSFQLSSQYLSDYKWIRTAGNNMHYLFNTAIVDVDGNPLPKSKLSDESILKNISLEKMNPVDIPEEKYVFNLHALTGFVGFSLETPSMGFGEKKYRQLFQDSIIEQTLKKKKVNTPNPPVTPLIERISLSYRSYDEINLVKQKQDERHRLYHLHPFGSVPVYPNTGQKALPFIFSMPDDANLLFGLKEAKGDETLNLYLDFFPQKKEIHHTDLPIVIWYWGNGYNWERLPDEALLKDTTQNLVMSGLIRIYLPEIRSAGMKDRNGLLWLCASIVKNATSIPPVKNIHTNAGRVYREITQTNISRDHSFIVNHILESIAGIPEIKQIASFSKGIKKEDEKAKLSRVAGYVSHRGKAVTARDYERLALFAFPEIQKIKCLPFRSKKEDPVKSTVSLVVIPFPAGKEDAMKPKAGAELLWNVESFFSQKVSGYVTVDAINPVYEEIMVRCTVAYEDDIRNRSRIRSMITQAVNRLIAPWQQKGSAPDFDHSFTLQELIFQIERLKLVKRVEALSVIHLSPEGKKQFRIREYRTDETGNDRIAPAKPQAILIPAKEHSITNSMSRFGVEEMKINENFLVWPEETEKP